MVFANPYLEGTIFNDKPIWHKGYFEIIINFIKKSKKEE
jgi:hypothetical protein